VNTRASIRRPSHYSAAAAGYKAGESNAQELHGSAPVTGVNFLVSRGLERGLRSWCSVKRSPAAESAGAGELFTVHLPVGHSGSSERQPMGQRFVYRFHVSDSLRQRIERTAM
jgi:hypothetical protein